MEEEEEGEGREGDRRGEGTSEGWMEAILRIFSGFALEPIVTAIPPSSLLLLPLPLLLIISTAGWKIRNVNLEPKRLRFDWLAPML